MSNGHSYLAPSASGRWTQCTASPKFIASLKLTGESSAYADEGTAAHHTFYTALGLDNPYDVPYGTEEEKQHLPKMFDWVLDTLALNPGAKLYREVAVDPAPYVRTGHCKGTADIVIPVNFGTLYVADLKFGVGVVVDAIDNLQLLLYALGALAKFEVDEGYIFNDIVMTILQPRAYHPDGPIREWRISYKEAMEWAKYLAARAREALGASPRFRPSDEACRFCPASGVCRHLAEFALGKARRVFSQVVDYEAEYKDVNTLSNVELGFILDNAKLFRKFLDDVYQHALGYTKRGGIVPGWGIKEKLGNRKWSISDEELVTFFGEEICELKKVVRSPAQAEKIFGIKSVAKFVTRESAGYALTPMNTQDTRETHDTMPFDEVDEDGS